MAIYLSRVKLSVLVAQDWRQDQREQILLTRPQTQQEIREVSISYTIPKMVFLLRMSVDLLYGNQPYRLVGIRVGPARSQEALLAGGSVPDLLYGNGYASHFNRELDIMEENMEEKIVDFHFGFVICVSELSLHSFWVALPKIPSVPTLPQLWFQV
jgi:hypothetical protein